MFLALVLVSSTLKIDLTFLFYYIRSSWIWNKSSLLYCSSRWCYIVQGLASESSICYISVFWLCVCCPTSDSVGQVNIAIWFKIVSARPRDLLCWPLINYPFFLIVSKTPSFSPSHLILKLPLKLISPGSRNCIITTHDSFIAIAEVGGPFCESSLHIIELVAAEYNFLYLGFIISSNRLDLPNE